MPRTIKKSIFKKIPRDIDTYLREVQKNKKDNKDENNECVLNSQNDSLYLDANESIIEDESLPNNLENKIVTNNIQNEISQSIIENKRLPNNLANKNVTNKIQNEISQTVTRSGRNVKPPKKYGFD